MAQPPGKSRRRLRRPSIVGLILLLALWSIILGIGLAQAAEPGQRSATSQLGGDRNLTVAQATPSVPTGTVDVVPQQYQLGQELYLENCATCHIPLPPQVFPTETWRDVLRDTQHYGVQVPLIMDPGRILVWNYLRTFSRPLLPDEEAPALLWQSRYLKALHPKIELPSRIDINSCASCHPGARQFDYRSLTPEWQDAP